MAMLEDAVEEFKKMPTAGKVAVVAAVVGVVGLALYMKSKSAAGASTSGTTSSGLANLSPTDLSGSTASGPGSTGSTSGSPTGTTPPPAPTPTNVFQGLLSGTGGTGLLGSGATVYYSGGQLFGTQPGGIAALLSSILPNGTRVWQGNQGRWWYALPGQDTQYLLTSGAGPDNPKNIGIDQDKIPSSAYTIGSTTSTLQPLQQGQLPSAPVAHPIRTGPMPKTTPKPKKQPAKK